MVRESENQILFLRNICFNITHTYQSLSLYFFHKQIIQLQNIKFYGGKKTQRYILLRL